MNLFLWMLLNLGVPIVGPIFTLALVAPTHGWRVAKTLIAASVKDGQLFWCAIGLCAAAVYEAVTALERGSGVVPILGVRHCRILHAGVFLFDYRDVGPGQCAS